MDNNINPLSISFSLYVKHSRFHPMIFILQAILPQENVPLYYSTYLWDSIMRETPDIHQRFTALPVGILFDCWIFLYKNNPDNKNNPKLL